MNKKRNKINTKISKKDRSNKNMGESFKERQFTLEETGEKQK